MDGNHKEYCCKTPHKTPEKARKAMVRARTTGIPHKGPKYLRRKNKGDTSIYHCGICGKWHWGHTPTKRGIKQ